MPPTEADLSLLTLDELWAEIQKRYDAALLLTHTRLDHERYEHDYRLAGSPIEIVGMAERFRWRCQQGTANEAITWSPLPDPAGGDEDE